MNVKKLINRPEDVVKEELAGMAAAHADLISVDVERQVIVRKDAPVLGKVGIISGGGSGHEPMHGGFVGRGVLDVIKNYTGDVLNFEMAAELAEAEGIKVASVVTNDDVAVQDSLYTAGRRGVGVTVLLEKIAGGLAETRAPLEQVAALAKKVNDQGRSMGIALTPCTVPTAGKPTFELSEDEMEIGIGIHGEPGRRRAKLAPAGAITEMLATPIIEDLGLASGQQVLAFVNGMGGTPLIELYVVAS